MNGPPEGGSEQGQTMNFELDDKFNFYIDLLCDDFCELDENGNYVIKPEARKQFEMENNASIMQQTSQTADPETEAKKEDKIKVGRWSDEEHASFLEALLIHGKDWDLIEAHIMTRDAAHIRSHAQKFFFKLVKYLEGDEEVTEIQNAEKYLEILKRKIDKPHRKKKIDNEDTLE
jgi:SHAQKYF class myb-like DNA-binding protein